MKKLWEDMKTQGENAIKGKTKGETEKEDCEIKDCCFSLIPSVELLTP